MSDLSTVDVAGEFIRAWDAESSGIIERFAHPDLTVFYTHFDEPIEGPDGFSNMLSMTHEYFPDLSITVNDVVDGADKTVVHWLYRATFVRGKMFGVEAVGQEVEVEGLTKYLFKDGQVVEERGIVDQFGLLNQLGVQLYWVMIRVCSVNGLLRLGLLPRVVISSVSEARALGRHSAQWLAFE